MPTVFHKLNLRANASSIVVLGAPASFEPELASLGDTIVLRSLDDLTAFSFVLSFVTEQGLLEDSARRIVQRASGDAVVWFAYPKGTSKRFKSGMSRDRGWQVLGDLGWEPVRAVAIDEDWSALRFRRVEFIKTMRRAAEHRLSAQGRLGPSRSSSQIR